MFYEVRILDSSGKVKKVLSSKRLSKKYWNGFFDKAKGPSTTGAGRGKGQKAQKSGKPKLDYFDDEYSEYSLTDN